MKGFMEYSDPHNPRTHGTGFARMDLYAGRRNFELMVLIYLRRGYDIRFSTDQSRTPGPFRVVPAHPQAATSTLASPTTKEPV